MNIFDKLSSLIPSIPFLCKNNDNLECFFAVNIGGGKVTASVWGVDGKKLHIINTASSKFESEEDLILASNYALDDALADFEPEPTKILFGVPDSWLQDDDLKEDKLKLLRRMVKELDVVPMAYVSTSHAISHLLQKQQSVPLTGILVEVADPLNVAIVKAGKVLSTRSQKRSGNLPEDIEKALLTVADIEVLPSKILIYGDKNLEKLKEEMTGYSWMSQLPFLHLPKIDQLEEYIIIKAVSFAGASEVYPDKSISAGEIEVNSLLSGTSTVSASGVVKGDKLNSQDSLEEFGFVKGDINENENLKIKNEKLDENEDRRKYEEDFAVPAGRQGEETAVDRNVASRTEIRRNPLPAGIEEYSFNSNMDSSPLGLVKSAVAGPLGFLKETGTGAFQSSLGKLLKIGIIPVLLILAFLGFLLFGLRADVTVFVDPRTLEKETSIIADPAIKSVDEVNKKIPGTIVETEISGSGKGSATGKKKIGDPAKGSVILYNKTSSSKNLAEGTILTGDNNLSFKLDNKVTIASQSAVEGGISFGKVTSSITASDIGPDGNLSAGKELSVKGFSANEVSAKVDQALSGGISKDVTVVTSDDQKKLLAQVSSELRTKAKDELQKKLQGDIKVLEESLAEKVVKQSFNKNVNDQASEFSLNLTSSYKGTAYSDTDLRQIVSKLVETNVPEGYMLDLTNTETQADVAKIEKDGKLVFTAKFKAKLMPKLNEDQIKKDIAFLTPSQVEEKLKTIESVIGAEIKTTPSLPSFLARMPFLANNITLHVTAK